MGFTGLTRCTSSRDRIQQSAKAEILVDLIAYVCEVQVMRFSDGSYLEDMDHWWFSGIYRQVVALSHGMPSLQHKVPSFKKGKCLETV